MTFDPRLTDLHILALTLYGECSGTRERKPVTLEELIALGCKIRNRVQLGSTYPTECQVCACWDTASESHGHLLRMQEKLLTGTVTDPRYIEAAWVALGMLNGYCRDVLKGATEGHPVTELPRPEWAQHRTPSLCYAKQSWYLPEGASA